MKSVLNDLFEDDITFCMSDCDNTKCFRHESNVRMPQYPHSVAYLFGTDLCERTNIAQTTGGSNGEVHN